MSASAQWKRPLPTLLGILGLVTIGIQWVAEARKAAPIIGQASAKSDAFVAPGAKLSPAMAQPGVVVGGPFQRVVYNVRTHLALATPGVFREGAFSFTAPTIRFNDQTHVAWASGACTLTDGGTTATSETATVNFSNKTVSMVGSVRLAFKPQSGGGQAGAVEVQCPSLVYQSATHLIQCGGWVQLMFHGQTRQHQPVDVAMRSPSLTYDGASGVARCVSGVSLTVHNGPGSNSAPDVSVTSPAMEYRSSSGQMDCSGGARLSFQGKGQGGQPSNVTVTAPGMRYLTSAGQMTCIGGGVVNVLEHNKAGQPVTITVNSPSLQYLASTSEMDCSGGVKLSMAMNAPPGQSAGPASGSQSNGHSLATGGEEQTTHALVSCPELTYRADTGLMTCGGGVQLALDSSDRKGHPAHVDLTCPTMEYATAQSRITCSGGAKYTLTTQDEDNKTVKLALSSPGLDYESDAEVVQCTGGVAGKLFGVKGLNSQDLPSVTLKPGGAVHAAPDNHAGEGPVDIRSRELSFDSQSHIMKASGSVHLAQGGASLQCQHLRLDTQSRTIAMNEDFGYEDSTGRRLHGSRADDDMKTHSVVISGPVSFADRDGNIVHSKLAKIYQKTDADHRTTRFTEFWGDVRLTNKDGARVHTPYVSIEMPPGGAQIIHTGPMQFQGHGST